MLHWVVLAMLVLATITILEVDSKSDRLLRKASKTVTQIDELKAQIAASIEVNRTALALVAALAAGKVNPADVQSMTDQLKASSDALAAAVAAHA